MIQLGVVLKVLELCLSGIIATYDLSIIYKSFLSLYLLLRFLLLYWLSVSYLNKFVEDAETFASQTLYTHKIVKNEWKTCE